MIAALMLGLLQILGPRTVILTWDLSTNADSAGHQTLYRSVGSCDAPTWLKVADLGPFVQTYSEVVPQGEYCYAITYTAPPEDGALTGAESPLTDNQRWTDVLVDDKPAAPTNLVPVVISRRMP